MKHVVMCAMLATVLVSGRAWAGQLGGTPKGYTPEKSWPVMVATQNNPDPQLANDAGYFLIHAGGNGVVVSEKVRSELVKLAGSYNVDPFRVYATSFSRGGHEILEKAWHHPDWFAAVAPLCNDLRSEPKLFNVKYIMSPVLLLHGTGDQFRETSKRLMGIMKEHGVDVTWQDYEGGHSPDPIFHGDLKPLTAFFEGKKMNPWPKEVKHLVQHKRYGRAFWTYGQLIEDAALDGIYKVKIGESNRIDVEANENICEIDLHLNDNLVDVKTPVTVWMGEKKLFEGPVPADSPVTVKIREPKQAYVSKERQIKTLWEEMVEARQKARTVQEEKGP